MSPLDDPEAVFLAVAHPKRRAILEVLLEGPQPVAAILERVPMTPPALSQHLKVLKEVGLVEGEKAGRQIFYRADAAPLRSTLDWMTRYVNLWNSRLDALGSYLEKENGKP